MEYSENIPGITNKWTCLSHANKRAIAQLAHPDLSYSEATVLHAARACHLLLFLSFHHSNRNRIRLSQVAKCSVAILQYQRTSFFKKNIVIFDNKGEQRGCLLKVLHIPCRMSKLDQRRTPDAHPTSNVVIRSKRRLHKVL